MNSFELLDQEEYLEKLRSSLENSVLIQSCWVLAVEQGNTCIFGFKDERDVGETLIRMGEIGALCQTNALMLIAPDRASIWLILHCLFNEHDTTLKFAVDLTDEEIRNGLIEASEFGMIFLTPDEPKIGPLAELRHTAVPLDERIVKQLINMGGY